MDRHFLIPVKYRQATKLKGLKGYRIIGYVFENTGNTVVNVRPFGPIVDNAVTKFDPFTLNPGDWIDTRNPGTIDATYYEIDFVTSNVPSAQMQASNTGELTTSIYILLP